MTRSLIFFLFVTACVPAPTAAQFGFADKLLGRVTDGGLFITSHGPVGLNNVTPEGLETRQGFGFELLFTLGRSQGFGTLDPDTTLSVTERKVTYHGRDSTVVVTSVPKVTNPAAKGNLLYELGVSYVEVPFSYQAGTSEIRGALRGLPMVTVYVSALLGYSFIYLGARAGLNSLSGVRGYTQAPPDSIGRVVNAVSKGGGDALHAGALVGAGAGYGPISLFVDLEYANRRIPSVQWEGNVPSGFPTHLRFSPVSLSFGVQVGSGTKLFP